MEWQLIESDRQLADLLSRAAGCDAVVVDTEFMRRNTFYPRVALVQLCFSGGGAGDVAWLIDPLKIQDTQPLVELFEDRDVVKVLHSAGEDLEVFQHWIGVLPQPLFDTQRAAAMVGMEFGLGYRGLILQLCGEDLPKGETQSDWLQRPLTESQCHYAAQDVSWLLQAWDILARRCRDQGKYDWVIEDGCDAIKTLATTAPDYYRRIKGAWKLSPRQLAVLIAVCDWREATARERDKPRSWIIDDKACLQLSQTQPLTRAELEALDLPPAAIRRYGATLLDLVASEQGRGEGELPERLPAPLDAGQRNQLKTLKRAASGIANELGVAPQVLILSRDYETLLRQQQGQIVEPRYWRGWRREVIIEPLRELLKEVAA